MVIESILKGLETLPAFELVEVARSVSALTPDRGDQCIAALKETAGCTVGQEGEAFERAAREEADRIDADVCPQPSPAWS